jgi:ABC-type multidrug transport system ATPase subunit
MLGASTGFNPELSGRENVYLSAAILGIPEKKVDKAFEQIVEFAGIPRMIDTPVKRYSSGMSIRLAFSVAVNLEPEILLVDEILTVGDYEFRLKSLERIKQLRAANNCTVVLVSHNLSIVKAFCEQALWLDRGVVKGMGRVDDVIRDYLREMESTEGGPTIDGRGLRHEGSGDARVEALRVLDASSMESGTIIHGERLSLELDYSIQRRVHAPVFSVNVVRVQDNIVATRLHSGQSELRMDDMQGRGTLRIDLPHLWLMPGEYRLTATIAGQDTIYDQVEGFPILRISPPLTMTDPRASFDASDMVTFVPAEWHLETDAQRTRG